LRSLLLLLLICYISFFYRLGDYGLIDPDEGRTAVIAKEILQTGNWLTLSHAGNPYYDKPAPYFWLVALGFKVFGLNEFAVRFPSALAASSTVLAVYLWGILWKDPERGLWGAMILASSIQFIGLGRGGRMDMPLVFFTTAALFYFLWWKERTDCRGPISPFYVLLGLASLVKGPVGAALPALVVAFFAAAKRKPLMLRQLKPLKGAVVFSLVVGPWYLLASMENPEYIRTFLWNHNVMRYLATGYGVNHPEPIYYFVPILLGGFLPWTLFTAPFAQYLAARVKTGIEEEGLFLIVWIVIVFGFFSLSRNKLGGYILPLFPALALLMGDFLRGATARGQANQTAARWLFGGALLWLLSLIFLSPITEAVLSRRNAEFLPFDPPVYPSALLLILLILARWSGRRKWVPWILCCSVLWISAWLFAAKAGEIAAVTSARSLALLVNSNAVRDFRTAALRAESFSFYLNSPVREVPSLAAIDRMLREPAPTVALVKDRHIARMNWDGSNRVFIWKRVPEGAAVIANFPYAPANKGSSAPPG
jgi:4-amino-4-deoxy-L-arabinose transferase-like glycosyltransferase